MLRPERSSLLPQFSRLARRCLAVAVLAARAVSPSEAQSSPGSQKFEITSIAFEGNSTLAKNELLAQMLTRETPGFLNKFLHNTISEKLGRKNEYLSLLTLGGDVRQLRTYYENRGFFTAGIDTSLAFHTDAGKVDVTIRIAEGYRSLIDTLLYGGIVEGPGTIWTEILSSPKIAQGDPYNAQLLEEEVGRVLKILANTGYPNARYLRDSSQATRYASTGNCSVRLRFNLGRMYFFGPIAIRQEIDSLRSPVPRDDITDEIILRQLTYVPGKRYSIEDSSSSASNLNRLGIFDLRLMDMKVPRRVDSSVTVRTSILFRPKDKHELGPELIVSDENGALNLGAGLSYTHRNFLGGARLFSTRLRFRTQTLGRFPDYFALNTDAVSNLDLTTELVQPYVFSNRIKGSWSFSYILDKEIPYLQSIIRNKFGFTDKLTDNTNGFLDWTLETVSSRKNDKFSLLSTDPQVQQEIRLLQSEQFNSILSFTILRDVTNDLFSPSDGTITSAEFDEAGLFPLLLQGAFPNLPISQFYRVILIARVYTEAAPHRFSILAFKIKGGIEDKYGGARSDTNVGIPQTHRFYAGGGNSVRGWNSRDLIAGGNSGGQLGGNLALETSVELRTNVLQSLRDGFFDKIWLVQFVDAGNVWGQMGDFRLNSVAIAAGIGIRYDTFFGPFRVDWGFRVYNPAESDGRRWITQRQLFGQTFKEAIFHFGIGNAY
ncbi:MAG TPA: BamA/TamA family outer membrane protein [Bacteroidota bacterium]